MLIVFSFNDIQRIISESNNRIHHTVSTGAMDHTTRGTKRASELGVFGEAAVSAMTGFPVGGFQYKRGAKKKDVGPLQVRTTERRVLYFKDFEDPMDPYIAVQVVSISKEKAVLDIVGWRFGFECQKDAWKRFPKNKKNMRPGQKCWWEAPHEGLYGLKSLRCWCESKEHPWEKAEHYAEPGSGPRDQG